MKVNHSYAGELHISVPEKELKSEVKITMDAGEELGVSLAYSAISPRPTKIRTSSGQ